MVFFKSIIKELLDAGNTVDIATNESSFTVPDEYRRWDCKVYQMNWSRSPFSPSNTKSVRELRRLVEENHYEIVHCHTPVAGVCTRLACKKLRKNGTRVFYTTHGFHFYKGAPFRNWLCYYPIERYCSRITDTLITINHEDYELAKKKMKAGQVRYVPGVGVDVDRFRAISIDRTVKREQLGIPKDAIVLISVGELNLNKNHKLVIQAMSAMRNDRIHYLIAGDGPMQNNLIEQAKKSGVEAQVHLLGFRNDIPELYQSADICVFPSIREGLGLAAIEAMAAGLPVICMDNRGSREYAPMYEQAGFSCVFHDEKSLEALILRLMNDESIRAAMAKQGLLVSDHFSVNNSNKIMKEIYGISES